MVSPSATAEQRNQLHAIAQTTIPSDTQDAWLWISTSGTTGQPRLIGLSDQQLTASADASQQRLGHQPNDRWLCCLPLHHIGGISIALRTATYQTTMVLHPQFDAATVSRAIDDHHITGFNGTHYVEAGSRPSQRTTISTSSSIHSVGWCSCISSLDRPV